MSWLRSLFGVQPKPTQSRHVGVLVHGTLWHAEMAASQLKMEGADEGMSGVANVFGMPGGLQAQLGAGQWVSLADLRGRWILVIPDDAYARFGPEFEAAVGDRPLDGRVKPTGSVGGLQLLNVSAGAVERLRAIVAQMPPLPVLPSEASNRADGNSSQPEGRITVGKCSACGRELRVKARAVRPTLHLTCKCGTKNVITSATDGTSHPSAGA